MVLALTRNDLGTKVRCSIVSPSVWA